MMIRTGDLCRWLAEGLALEHIRPLPRIILAVGFAFVTAGCTRSQVVAASDVEGVVPVTVSKVELVPLDQTLSIVGTLFGKDEATLGAEVEGKVEKTLVDFGDRIKVGQELALVDTTSYEALERQAAANVAKAKASALNAEQNLKRTQDLRTSNIASQSQLDQANAESAQANAEVQAAEAAHGIAKLNLERSRAKAPFDGAVSERIANAGDYMKVGSPLFRVVNDRVLKYIVQAPERYADQVQKDQVVEFTVDAWPGRVFEGKVYLISPSVNTVTRSFPFGALVQNSDGKLKANSFARGQLLIKKSVPTPMVPVDAVINFAGVTKVFVVEGDTVRAREVQLGRIKDGRQEIVSGLKPEEVVVLTGQTKLQDGTRVRFQVSPEVQQKPT